MNRKIHPPHSSDPVETSINFRGLIENLKVGVYRSDPGPQGKFLFVNPALGEILGYGRDEILRIRIADIYDNSNQRRHFIEKIISQGYVQNAEIKLKRKNGNVIWCSVTAVAVKDRQGKILWIDGILEDVAVHHKVKRELVESKELFRLIFDNSAVAIIVTDKDEKILAWNLFVEKLLAMSKEDLFNKPVKELYSEGEWDRIDSLRIRQKGIISDLETKIITKNSAVLDASISISTLRDFDGNIIGSVGIMQDITERKQAQELILQAKLAAEEANRSKTIFLANMSHEVRTPMNAIMGMIDLTLDTPLSDEQKDNLRTIKDAAGNLLSLLNDILDLSRVEVGKINLEAIEFNLRNIMQSICKGLEVLARRKNLQLTWDINSDVPDLLIGDPVRLRQVIINLINNAIKFTLKGKIEVKVSVSTSSPEEVMLVFSVLDTGSGIPQGKLSVIFDAFTQADDSTTRRFGGTGLGLAISRRLVEMMGGRIWVESKLWKGSTFYFSLPLTIPKKETLTPIVSHGQEEVLSQVTKRVDSLKGLRVLLVEDNLVNRKIATKLFEKRGWVVQVAGNGQEAIDLFNQERFDVIFMDVQMPVLDGFETTRIIREEEKQTGRHIPIVAMTAHAMEGDEKKCLEAGMDVYISKPIDPPKVFETIENLMSKRTEK